MGIGFSVGVIIGWKRQKGKWWSKGRSGGIRTLGLYVPNVARYHCATLRSKRALPVERGKKGRYSRNVNVPMERVELSTFPLGRDCSIH